MNLTVSNSAFNRVAQLLCEDSTLPPILRVSVEGGGCAGFMYNYEFTTQIEKDDYIVEQNDIKVVVDSSSMVFMNNCIVDFVEELTGSYFQVNNPNATAKCGCNNSFSI